jgi:alpha-tubulin suppressor-like RCC1 family protein
MHCAALTHDNKILTWGVNDTGALGRRTGAAKTVEITPKEASVDSDSDSEDEDDEYLNPTESEPREVNPKYFPEGTQFAQLAASDSATFAITTDGSVYGWGTFRVSYNSLIQIILVRANINRAMMVTWVSDQRRCTVHSKTRSMKAKVRKHARKD